MATGASVQNTRQLSPSVSTHHGTPAWSAPTPLPGPTSATLGRPPSPLRRCPVPTRHQRRRGQAATAALTTAGRWTTGPVGEALRRATEEIDLGRPTADALEALAPVLGRPPAPWSRSWWPRSATGSPWVRASTEWLARPASTVVAGPKRGPAASRSCCCSPSSSASCPPSAPHRGPPPGGFPAGAAGLNAPDGGPSPVSGPLPLAGLTSRRFAATGERHMGVGSGRCPSPGEPFDEVGFEGAGGSGRDGQLRRVMNRTVSVRGGVGDRGGLEGAGEAGVAECHGVGEGGVVLDGDAVGEPLGRVREVGRGPRLDSVSLTSLEYSEAPIMRPVFNWGEDFHC